MRNIEKFQERCLRRILDDCESNYDALLHKFGKSYMEVKRFRTLAIELFKTLKNQNPSFVRDPRSPYVSHKKQNLFVQSHETATFGNKNLKTLGPHILNSLPEMVKSVTILVDFKNSIKRWFTLLNVCATYALLKMNIRNWPRKSFITHTTYKFIFIQFCIFLIT